MFFRYHGNFSIKLSHIPSYITTYKNSKTKRAQEKACFLSILQISKHASVARCWLSVDFYLSCHKHTSKLLVALSRVYKSLLDRFLDRKTWFFVFSDFYARCVPKGLNDRWYVQNGIFAASTKINGCFKKVWCGGETLMLLRIHLGNM